MTIEEVKNAYGHAEEGGYVYCDECPLGESGCELEAEGVADGFGNCWETIAKRLNKEAPSKREPIAPTQFERNFAEAIKRIDDGAYTTGDVEMCRTALEFIGAARELADRLRTEREAQE